MDYPKFKTTYLKLIKTIHVLGHDVNILEGDDEYGFLKEAEAISVECIKGPEYNYGFSLVFFRGVFDKLNTYDSNAVYRIAEAEVREKILGKDQIQH